MCMCGWGRQGGGEGKGGACLCRVGLIWTIGQGPMRRASGFLFEKGYAEFIFMGWLGR